MPDQKRKQATRQTLIGYRVVQEKSTTANGDGLPHSKNMDYHSRIIQAKIPLKWDETYTRIIEGIELGLGRNALAEKLNLSQNATFNRLQKLEKLGLITKRVEKAQTIIGGSQNRYTLTVGWYKLLGSIETTPLQFDFDGAHNWAFQFKIVSGEVPKSDKEVHMNNWDFYVFAGEDLSWSIQVCDTTEPSFIVFPQVDLGSGTVAELQQRYSNFAQKIAQFFAFKNRLQISLPDVCREQHFEKRNDPVAKAIKAMFGDMRTPSLRADNTPKKDTLEIVGADTARALEWTVTEMPKFAGHVEGRLNAIESKLNTILAGLDRLPKEKVQHYLIEKPKQEPQPTLAMLEPAKDTAANRNDVMYG